MHAYCFKPRRTGGRPWRAPAPSQQPPPTVILPPSSTTRTAAVRSNYSAGGGRSTGSRTIPPTAAARRSCRTTRATGWGGGGLLATRGGASWSSLRLPLRCLRRWRTMTCRVGGGLVVVWEGQDKGGGRVWRNQTWRGLSFHNYNS